MDSGLFLFLLKEAPKQLLWSLAILLTIITIIMRIWPYWDQVIPKRRAFAKRKRKLEFLKLWFEVEELRKRLNLSEDEEHSIDLLQDLQFEKTTVIQREKNKTDENLQPAKKIYHPFLALSKRNRGRLFILLLITTLILMFGLQHIGNRLVTHNAAQGILSFELAGDYQTAYTIMHSWGSEGRLIAGLSLGIDFLFLVVYSTLLSQACIMLALTFQDRFSLLFFIGIILAWFQWAAGILDAIENYALIQLLLGASTDLWPVTAKWCAVIKFAIVALGQLYIMMSLILFGISRLSKKVKKEKKRVNH
jgi:hypothetical protein